MEHIIFDCDGVIVDSEVLANQIWVEALEKLGIEETMLSFGQKYAGLREEQILARIEASHDFKFPAGFLPDLFAHMDEVAEARVEPVPGMPELIRSYQLPKSVVSNSDSRQIKRSLRIAELTETFEDRCFTSNLVAHPKPAPDLYLMAIEHSQLDPEKSIVVEDSVTGVTAARAAGLPVIGFIGASHHALGHADRLRELGVVAIAHHAEELAALLKARGAY